MRTNTPEFIDGLVDDLQPHRPLTLRRGLLTAMGSAGLTIGITALFIGIRPQLIAGNPDPLFLLASGLFLMLGVAASYTVVAMNRPQVGNAHACWIWAIVMAALLPLTAIVIGLVKDGNVFIQSAPAQGVNCVINGSFILKTDVRI